MDPVRRGASMGSQDRATELLLIDDDVKLCRLIGDYLEPMGYHVTAAHTGEEGLAKALAGSFAAIILDVMLPDLDGFEVLKRLRARTDTPVLMLTARGEETDRIVGLELGADDYLPKTFSTRELLARLRAVTRRSQAAGPQAAAGKGTQSVGRLTLDPDACQASLDGRPLELTPIEYKILLCLFKARDRVLSREQILQHVSGRGFESFDRSLDMHISAIRRKLGESASQPRYIKTVRGFGYMLMSAGG